MARLLIVDDEDLVRLSLRRVLERGGHSVEEAVSVGEARECLAAGSFDLILCDINMAGESGLALVRQVAAELPDTAVVMVTGVDDPEVADEAVTLGAYGYLVKPFQPNEVLINVHSGLRRRSLERARRSYTEELESKVLVRGSALRDALKRLDEAETGAELAERGTVARLVTALTLRSEETGGHIERMSRYAAALAARRGIHAWTWDEFRLAAMLHDVGKIGVPDSILLKPGPLTGEEFAAIKRHPDLGASLLNPGASRVLILGARIALTHHERWDGSGYPAGLMGDAIAVEGRVAAVADVFDALTSHRIYRPAMSPEAAMELMLAERARQFDPDLLDLFAASLEEMLTIRERHAEPAPPAEVRVAVVDGRRLFTDALVRVLASTEGITVVGTARSAADAERVLAGREVDVVVIDAALTDPVGVDLAARIVDSRPETAVILLAARDDDTMLLRALDAGCAGVVQRDRAFDDLAAAIVAANAGEPVMSPSRLMALLGQRTSGSDPGLTPREVEVLRLMAEGLSNKAIAARLVVSLNTARNHSQRILTKLSAHSKLEAIAEANRRGLLPRRA